jgi:predicted XRE-type DNA-binding protein
LFAGTPNDNMQDKVKKGRQSKGFLHAQSFSKSRLFIQNQPRGENHGQSKLSDIQRMEILDLISNNIKQKDIAKKFNVTQGTISHTARKWNKVSHELY